MNTSVIMPGIVAAALAAGLLSGAGLAAQDYYAVSGVDPDDVLNVRMGPSASAPIIGALAHDASPVEIVRTENGWGMFPAGEMSGWVSMNYLSPIDQPMIGTTAIPEGMMCVGTEPFWVVTVNTGGVIVSHQNWEHDRTYSLNLDQSSADPDRVSSLSLEDGSAVISPGQCSDGMSDAEFGWNGRFVLGGPDHASILHGCCALEAPSPMATPPDTVTQARAAASLQDSHKTAPLRYHDGDSRDLFRRSRHEHQAPPHPPRRRGGNRTDLHGAGACARRS